MDVSSFVLGCDISKRKTNRIKAQQLAEMVERLDLDETAGWDDAIETLKSLIRAQCEKLNHLTLPEIRDFNTLSMH